MEKSGWFQSIEEVCSELKTDPQRGLSHAEAQRRLEQFGYNELPEQKHISPFLLFLNQFNSVIIWILIAATLIAAFLGEWADTLAISLIVVFNALLGFWQEYRAEKSMTALLKITTPTSKVVREGQLRLLPSRDLVPGDLILIEAGDRLPADGRIIQSFELSTQEGALTGESLSIHKSTEPLENSPQSIGDKKNMGFLGTVAVKGKGFMIATDTGFSTELGQIAALLQRGIEEPTPLQMRLQMQGIRLVWICLGIVVLVFGLGFLRGTPLIENLLISVSLAVAAIPEGLPAIITIALSIGVHKMAKRQALMRRLYSVETLGCTTVICTDKTGTLTQNEMVVRSIWVNDTLLEVTGTNDNPDGQFEVNLTRTDPKTIPELMMALKIGVLCNSAELHLIHHPTKSWSITGDPTEGALLAAAAKADLFKQDLEKENPLLAEIPFDSERKRMSMVRDTTEGPNLFIKGAPDLLLNQSHSLLLNGKIGPLTELYKQKILTINAELASRAWRILAVGYRPLSADAKIDRAQEEKIVFVGLIAMHDPARPEAKRAIETCAQAGITTVMITGDHKETAVAVAKELDFMKSDSRVVTGAELEEMSDAQLRDSVRHIAIYARTSAAHKLRIVDAWQSLGEVVAMTGDGVNDAPALKKADIGIAMGITGTDVTKQAADMILLDDNFASIVNAVQEGRGIYDNIMKFVSYLFSTNIAELFVVFAAVLVGFTDFAGNPFVPLTAVQILWINLVSDGFPAIALGFDPIDPSAMTRPPRKLSDPLYSTPTLLKLFALSLLVALGALIACYWGLYQSRELAQTMTFTTIVVLELVMVQIIRAPYHLHRFSNPIVNIALVGSFLLQLSVIYTPFLQTLFKTVPLGLSEWGVILTIATLLELLGRFLVQKEYRTS